MALDTIAHIICLFGHGIVPGNIGPALILGIQPERNRDKLLERHIRPVTHHVKKDVEPKQTSSQIVLLQSSIWAFATFCMPPAWKEKMKKTYERAGDVRLLHGPYSISEKQNGLIGIMQRIRSLWQVATFDFCSASGEASIANSPPDSDMFEALVKICLDKGLTHEQSFLGFLKITALSYLPFRKSQYSLCPSRRYSC